MRVTMVALLFTLALTAPAHAAAPVAFEDVNNNGTWDVGVDRDVTQTITTQRELVTPNGIVVTGTLKPLDPKLKQTGSGGCAYLRAGKSITVQAGGILCPFYDGTVVLWADGAVTIGDGVLLTGKNRVNIAALGPITIGNGVTMSSSGGSANQGVVALSGYGAIVVGTGLTVTALKDVSIDARGGPLTLGLGAKLTSLKATVRLLNSTMPAVGNITLDGAKLKGADIDVTSFTGAITFRTGSATVPKTGLAGIYSYTKTVDVTGTRFSGPSSIWPTAARAAAKK